MGKCTQTGIITQQPRSYRRVMTQKGVGGWGQPAEGSDVKWHWCQSCGDQTSKSDCLISRWSCGGGTWPQSGEDQHGGRDNSGTRWPGKSLSYLVTAQDWNLHPDASPKLPTPFTLVQSLSLSQSPGVCSNWCPLSWWCHPTISSSVASFSCCPQSFPASESFTMSWLFTSGGQSIGASASVLLVNFQGWFPLGLIMIYKCLLNCFVACSIYIW